MLGLEHKGLSQTRRPYNPLWGHSCTYTSKCVGPARLFVNRNLATLRQTPNDGTITLSPEFKRDMAWFNAFLPVFNGKVYFDKRTKPTNTNLYVDACLTSVGRAWGNLVFALPLDRLVSLPIPCTIIHLEMIIVYIALSMWKHRLSGKAVVIHCDNMASFVCSILVFPGTHFWAQSPGTYG